MQHADDSFEVFARGLIRGLRGMPINVVAIEDVDSTNSLARRVLDTVREEGGKSRPTVFAAWEQTAGRGRFGSQWLSPAGRGVYLSLVLLDMASAAVRRASLVAGVAVCHALMPIVKGELRLKWPNDILLDGQKVAGLLVETTRRGEGPRAVVVGCGVNVLEPPPVAQATALARRSDAGKVRLADVAVRCASALWDELSRSDGSRDVAAEYRGLLIHRVGEVLAIREAKKVRHGRYRGIDEQGRLCVEIDGREERIVSGAVDSGERRRDG